MKKHALDATAKANGISVLRGLVDLGKTYESAPDHKVIARRRAKAKAAKVARRRSR